jgi:PKHD-type hydroxylase
MSEHKIAKPCGYYAEVLPPKLLDLIVEEIEKISEDDYKEATVGGGEDSKVSAIVRDSKITWWYETHWVTSIISHYFNKINRDFWEYDLTCLNGIQITTYNPGDHYNWHCDYGISNDDRYTRKISMTLLISDPNDYEGGDLEIIDYHGNTLKVLRERGTMIFFDSRIPHRVTPVIKGKRISLVAWMLGPKLR